MTARTTQQQPEQTDTTERDRGERAAKLLLEKAPLTVVRRVAQAAAQTRPLTPEPGWYFDKSEEDARELTSFRRTIWRHFNEHRIEQPITVRWYDGLRFRLYLGNDLSKCLFVGGSFEPNEFAFLGRILQPGMVFVDGGANDGLYTLFAAKRVGHAGRVVAVEPSPRELGRLTANVRLNRLRNVTAVDAALHSRDGDGSLALADYGHEGQNTVGAAVANPKVGTRSVERIRLVTLDRIAADCGLERLDVLKLDLEGSEVNALEGATATIRRFRPLLQVEVADDALAVQGSTREEIFGHLAAHGYRHYVFDPETAELRPPRDGELDGNVIAGPDGWTPPRLAAKPRG